MKPSLKTPLLILCTLMFLESTAQLSIIHHDPQESFRTAMDLFYKEKYSAAFNIFHQLGASLEQPEYSLLKAESDYYAAICGMELFNDDSYERLEAYVEEHPTSKHSNEVYFYRGNAEFRNRSYSKALKSYAHVDVRELGRDQADEYYFKTGYSHLRLENNKEAGQAFARIRPGNTRYSAAVKYYKGHLAYSSGNYEEALSNPSSLSDHKVFGEFVPYYLLHIYFLQEDWEKVTATAPSLLEHANEKRVAEINRIMADALFHQKEYASSVEYYGKYLASPGVPFNREDHYQAAYAAFLANDYTRAIPWFERVTAANDTMAQNAFYHLGFCFLKTGEKKYAWNAFKSASRMDFNLQIKEDALFNYAKLAYELTYNPFNEAITALRQYISTYPESERIEEAYTYLLDLLMSTRNYSSAYEIIQKISRLSDELRNAYQRIAYNHGVELFLAEDFTGSIGLFQKAIEYGDDRELAAGAYFWAGEAYIRLGKPDNALDYFNKFLVLPGAFNLDYYPEAYYNTAYIWFGRKNYQEAANAFRKYIRQEKGGNDKLKADAIVRTGDCFFKMKQYNQAIEFYDQVIALNSADADYATFQKGMALGVSDRYNEKVKVLEILTTRYPKSSFRPDAFYELGSTYLILNNSEKALQYFQNLTQQYPNSDYVRRSLNRTGLIHYNAGFDDLAIKAFKQVIEGYPGSRESHEALASLKNIYVEMNRTEEYFKYASSLSFASVTRSEQDSTLYLAAENQYMNGNCQEALKGFDQYLSQFPQGTFFLSSTFYRSECLLKEGRTEEALNGYEVICSKPKSSYLENSLLKASDINFRKKNYEKALVWYEMLLSQADFRNNYITALTGQMRCSHYLALDEKALKASSELLSSEKVPANVIIEAHLIKAKSSLALNDYATAKSEFHIVSKLSQGEYGAEALYYVAFLEFEAGNYDKAESFAYQTIDEYGSYDHWMAKSFLLLSDIFELKGNRFQAKQTLQSIIDNHQGKELVELAKAKLRILEDKELQEILETRKDTLVEEEDIF